MSGFKSVFIAGATGKVGEPITDAFLNEKWDVYVLARPDSLNDPKKKAVLDQFKSRGVHLVEGDVSKPETFKEKLKGIDVVISTLSGGGFGAQLGLLNAAKESGVKRFVPSEFGADLTKINQPFFGPKIAVRDELKKGGIEYTLIVTGFFNEILFSSPHLGFDAANGNAVVPGDGSQKMSLVSISDFTRVLPKVLQDPRSKNAQVNLFGDTLPFSQLVDKFEHASGKKIERSYLSVATIEASLKDAFAKSPGNPFAGVMDQFRFLIATGGAEIERSDVKTYNLEPFQSVDQYFLSQKK